MNWLRDEVLFLSDYHVVRKWRERVVFHTAVPRIGQHVAEFSVGVGITFGSTAEHGETECGRHGRRNTILIRHELDDGNRSAGIQRAMTLREKLGVLRRTEVMED